jgi:hypothetical protein
MEGVWFDKFVRFKVRYVPESIVDVLDTPLTKTACVGCLIGGCVFWVWSKLNWLIREVTEICNRCNADRASIGGDAVQCRILHVVGKPGCELRYTSADLLITAHHFDALETSGIG